MKSENEVWRMLRKTTKKWLFFGLPLFTGILAQAALPALQAYNVIWDSPSKDVSGTMPLGNGDISANVWVQDGDLLSLIGKPDLVLARNTYATRKFKETTCWHQDQVQSALLGLTEETRRGLIARASAECHGTSRFPAFWNAFHDWVPDIDHGGNLQLALQYMLMQAEPGATGMIRLLPTWPMDWNADFKLHAPGNTTVECVYRNGKLETLNVAPKSRAKDIILPAGLGAAGMPVPAKPASRTVRAAADGESISLAGPWRFATDTNDSGLGASPDQWRFPETVQLPGQVAAQGFGEIPSKRTQWAELGWRYPDLFKEWQADDHFKMPYSLQPPRRFVAPAWYQKVVEIPAEWNGKHALLHLERVHWQTTAWINGNPIGKSNSLGTPHEFDLGALPPGKHILTLRIDNRIVDVNPGIFAHSVTDATQGNWNGVVGKMELRPVAALRIHEARVEPSLDRESVHLVVTANQSGSGKVTGKVRYLGPLRDVHETDPVTVPMTDGKATLAIPMGRAPRPWNEFTPHLYQAEITMESASGKDIRRETFGFRDIGKKGGRLAINGRPIYLRGTLECCIFPLTGYPPTEIEPWRRIIRICREHGLNHMRFHSWCPPEAAFIAADEAGFYFQVEASAWASFGVEIGSGTPLDAWIDEETARMIREYGNHPSFLMMAYGNEPSGPNHARWLQDYVARWKAKDPRRFWTTAAGWPLKPGSDFHHMVEPRIQGLGLGMNAIISAQPPRTDFDWSDYEKAHPDAPIVSHEIGQWCAYPNFEEIPKYTGFFKPKNFEIFLETANRNGLLPQAKGFLMASGKLQTLCYKHEIEAALRTHRFGGFQLLDLHDFPGQGTALVGVLDAFWDSKGYVTPEEYARFAGPVVPLARLKKMTWQTNESLEGELLLSHFGPEDFVNMEPIWKLSDGDKVVATGKLPACTLAANALHELGSISVPLHSVQAPAQLKLTVGAAGHKFSNDWDVFVYPSEVSPPAAVDVTITDTLEDALVALDTGKTVLWTPPSGAVKNDPLVPFTAGFPPTIWNAAWAYCQPPHTLGILCDPEHPALARFPTEFHSNWQWWELQKDARPFILTQHHELLPVVQIIDDWLTNRKLGYIFEAQVGKGKLLACSFDIESNLDTRIVARQMRHSLLNYLKSNRFAPEITMNRADLNRLVVAPPSLKTLGAKVTASNAEFDILTE